MVEILDDELKIVRCEMELGCCDICSKNSRTEKALWFTDCFLLLDEYKCKYEGSIPVRVIFAVACDNITYLFDDATVLDEACKRLCKLLDNVSVYYAHNCEEFAGFMLEELEVPHDVIKFTDLYGYYLYALEPFYHCIEVIGGYIYFSC